MTGRLTLTRYDLGVLTFAVLAALDVQHFLGLPGRLWVLGIGPLALLALILRARPTYGGIAIVTASVILRLASLGIGYADQLDIAHAAVGRVFSGENPYGSTVFNHMSYPYGPLGLVWWQGGVPLEAVLAIGTLGLLVVLRAWITLAIAAAFPYFVDLTFVGINDYSVGFLITAALLLAARHGIGGALLLAVAAGIKPYAAAWYLPLIGYAGVTAAAVLLVASVALWLPVITIWTPAAFLRSQEILEQFRRVTTFPSAGSLDIPVLRLVAIPISTFGLFARNWHQMVLAGSLAFFVFLFFSPWTSAGYWIALMPITGIALERRDSWIGGVTPTRESPPEPGTRPLRVDSG